MAQEDDAPPLVIFDCQLFLQAAIRGSGPAAACFDLVERGLVSLVISEAVLAEVQDVLARPPLVRKYPQLASPRVAEFLTTVVVGAIKIDPVPEAFSYPRDPKDQPYLNLAIASGAHYLVSRDTDLLDLQAPDSEPGQALRALTPQLSILNPVSFLQRFTPPVEEC